MAEKDNRIGEDSKEEEAVAIQTAEAEQGVEQPTNEADNLIQENQNENELE